MIRIHSEKVKDYNSEGQQHRYDPNSGKTTTRTDSDATNKILEQTRGKNKANQTYGKGTTFASREVAVARLGKVAFENGPVKAGGEVAVLEARARTYGTKTSRGAEAQASVARLEYGFAYSDSYARVGQSELIGAGAKGNVEGFLGAQVKAEAGVDTKKGIPYAYAGAYAFAGARVSASGEVEVRVAGAGTRAQGDAYAWAGAQAQAEVTANPTGVHAEAGAFAGASAGVEGKLSFMGIGIGASAEASAGIGAQAGFDAGYDAKDHEIKLGFDAGAALGVGGGYGVDVAVDLDELIGDAGKVAETAGAVAGEVAETVSGLVEDGAEAVGNAVEAGSEAAGDVISWLNPWD